MKTSLYEKLSRTRSDLFKLGGYLFWPILAIKLFSWLTESVDTYQPAPAENYVLFTSTQPFHETIKLKLIFHKQDGWLSDNTPYSDWAYQLKNGHWEAFYRDEDENMYYFIRTNYLPYKN